MNKLTIIGNLTKDPELRVTTTGVNVCSFTVAVNRRKKVEGQPEADYFRVVTWKTLAELCARFLSKGRKVGVIGEVSLNTWEKDGKHGAGMEISAQEVEFLSPKQTDSETGMEVVTPNDLPY